MSRLRLAGARAPLRARRVSGRVRVRADRQGGRLETNRLKRKKPALPDRLLRVRVASAAHARSSPPALPGDRRGRAQRPIIPVRQIVLSPLGRPSGRRLPLGPSSCGSRERVAGAVPPGPAGSSCPCPARSPGCQPQRAHPSAAPSPRPGMTPQWCGLASALRPASVVCPSCRKRVSKVCAADGIPEDAGEPEGPLLEVLPGGARSPFREVPVGGPQPARPPAADQPPSISMICLMIQSPSSTMLTAIFLAPAM